MTDQCHSARPSLVHTKVRDKVAREWAEQHEYRRPRPTSLEYARALAAHTTHSLIHPMKLHLYELERGYSISEGGMSAPPKLSKVKRKRG